MTRQELGQLRFLGKELELLREEKRMLESRIDSMGRWPDGMPRSGQVGDPVANLATELAKADELLTKHEAKVQAERNRCIEFVASIPDSRTRQIFYLRCVSCLPWSQITHKMGEDSYVTVMSIYHRYLESSEKKVGKHETEKL